MQTKLQLIRRFQQHVKNAPVYTTKCQRNNMKTDVFDIVCEAITISKVQGMTSVPRLRDILLARGYSVEDIQSAFTLIATRIMPSALGTRTWKI